MTSWPATMSGIAPSHGLVVSQVRLHPDKAAGDVYDGLPFLKPNEVAIAKIGLRKLAEGAGMSLETLRMDPRTLPHYWEVKAIATYRGIDGALVRREATKEWDLRDGSPQLKGWTPKQIEEARKHGLRNCEARAINAVIREFGIRQKYTREELAKPFVVVRVSFQPDLGDPEIKKLVTQSALSATSTLYPGGAPALAPAPIVDEPAPEPRLVGSSAVTPSTSGTVPPATTSPAAAAGGGDGGGGDAPPSEDAVRIVEVKAVKEGTSRNGGKWTLWKVIDGQGVEYSTLDDEVAAAAQKARDAKAWVECITETKGEYTNLVELAPAGQSPRLPLPSEGDL